MIKQITLQNFQSHKNTHIVFSDKVNCFTGATDSGKSAIIRAIKWVLTNRPSGNSFVNHDAFAEGKQIAPCRVVLETDKHIVERYRSATKNSYTVDGVELKAIGTDVPIEVVQALNMNDINVQFQMDKPFLLTESAGEVARILNRIVKLDDIDTTLKQLNTYGKRLTTEKKTVIVEKQQLQTEIETLESSLTTFSQAVWLAEQLNGKYTQGNKTLHAMSILMHDIACLKDILEHSTILQQEELIDNGLLLHIQYKDVSNNYYDLEELLDKINVLKKHTYPLAVVDTALIDDTVQQYKEIYTKQKQLNTITTECTRLQQKHYTLLDANVSHIDTILHNYKEIQNKQIILDNSIQKIVSYKQRLRIKQKAIQEAERIVKDMIGDVCPVCGAVICK